MKYCRGAWSNPRTSLVNGVLGLSHDIDTYSIKISPSIPRSVRAAWALVKPRFLKVILASITGTTPQRCAHTYNRDSKIDVR